MTEVSTAFGKAAAEQRAALVGYLPAGFPSVDAAIDTAIAMVQAGVDVVEIGLPTCCAPSVRSRPSGRPCW